MKRTLARFVLPIALFSMASFAQSNASPAPDAGSATKVGIINIQQAILQTNEGKRELEALQKKFDPTRTELQGLQKEVDDMKKQLDTQGSKMNDDAKNKLVRDIDTKQKTLQRKLEDAQQDFQSQQGEIVNRIGTKLMEVVDKYAKANGYAAIFDVSNPQSPVLWAAQSTEITKEIADAYNAEPPAAPAPAGGVPSAPTPRPSAAAHSSAGTTAKSTPK
jgi:outer membrane protein